MIRNSKQSWEVGEVVRVGFLSLRVVEKVPTPGDHRPDAYILVGLGQGEQKRYRFVPHNGLERIYAEQRNTLARAAGLANSRRFTGSAFGALGS